MKDLVKTALSGKYLRMAKDKIRYALTFDPDDPDRMSQQPPAKNGYRFPAPGSITGARIPNRVEDKDGKVDPYDPKSYTYDPRNVTVDNQVFLNAASSPDRMLEDENLAKLGRPMDKGPAGQAVLKYDPSGLRVPNTAGWEAFEAEMMSHQPDHNVTMAWMANGGEDKLNAECERKGLPPMIGKRFKWNVPKHYNTNQW